MAYHGQRPGYEEAQSYQRPHDPTRQYGGYSSAPQDVAGYPPQQRHQPYQQQSAHDPNQQYSLTYSQDQTRYDQRTNGPQYRPQVPLQPQPQSRGWQHQQEYGQVQDQQQQQQQQPQPQSQSRQYQYDDRFRNGGGPTQYQGHGNSNTNGNGYGNGNGNGREQPPTGRRSPQSRPGTSASNRKMKQDRILRPGDPDAAKAIAWDNPFGAFPGAKREADNKKKDTAESRSQSRTDAPADRPFSSSHPNEKQSLDEPRPHTSHAHRPQAPDSSFNNLHQVNQFNQQLGPLTDMPIRKKPINPQSGYVDPQNHSPAPLPSNILPNFDLPPRPLPHRSATGPPPETHPIAPDPRTVPQQYRGPSSRDPPYSPNRHEQRPLMSGRDAGELPSIVHEPRSQHADRAQYPPVEARPTPTQYDYRSETSPHRAYGPTARSDQSYARPSHNSANAMPDFSVDPRGPARDNRDLGMESSLANHVPMPQAYRKPTYGDAPPNPSPARPGLIIDPSSQRPVPQRGPPTENFDFGLPIATDAAYLNPQVNRSSPLDTPHDQQSRQQYPPRSGSRPNPTAPPSNPGFSHSYNQPQRLRGNEPYITSPVDYGVRAPPSRSEYGFDAQGYPVTSTEAESLPRTEQTMRDATRHNDRQAHRPLARTHTEPVTPVTQAGRDRYNHGYEQTSSYDTQNYDVNAYPDPGRQPRNGPVPPLQDQGFDPRQGQMPARPRTANSARLPAEQYSGQPLPAHPRLNPGYPMSDRNHPVPVRPGLIEPTHTPSPTPMTQQATPLRTAQPISQHSSQPSITTINSPVTVQELDDLRNAFNSRPNDDKAGLKLAKKLAEAAKVLASEGGRADAKTTAKNRERYINEAYRIVKKLVSGNSQDAMFYLADCHGQGSLGLEVNAKEAFHLYTSAAKLGHAQSAYRVAVCCELGPDGGGGTRRDHFKAVQFYKKAATLGDGPAMFKMGMILLKGLLGAQPNRREGISWLKRAAERADADNPHALHELALLYENAQSTDVIIRDERYSLQLYTQAANLGYKYSQWRLGSAYEYGSLGIQIDPRQSIAWYSRAAVQGEHQSEFALSGWYLTGSEPLLAQSDQEAYLWARKAASSGLSKAEYAMGYYTEVGIGCKSDVEEAKKWYFRAAAQQDVRAKERLEEIKRGGARKVKTRISRTNVGRQNEGECSVM